ncbi:Pr6Pr family membrane protein [Mucilaginibacter glaciei]|uniref:Pr6Pr family membrane protein n=1 Tax=Mucilaginibacter glaciei TaxID=2772109 RepID=A0A926NYZ8_9SPHI|nr:Pr6Pr family membrane protein [Mucilaginibacter glaciei]MBD1394498.1 Pr6Pr family membrane protein [Mucilaginibacter glaciei]
MGRPYIKTYRVCAGIIGLLALLGVALQFCTAIPAFLANGRTLAGSLVEFFSFFTIQSNLLVAISLFITSVTPIRKNQFFNQPSVVTAITVYISIVSLVYNLLLSQLANYKGMAKLGDELVHLIVPVLVIVYWLTAVLKDKITWKDTIRWLWYPAAYLVYIFIRGALSGFYPYFFLDAAKFGYPKVLVNIVVLMLVFFCFSIFYVAIARFISRTS